MENSKPTTVNITNGHKTEKKNLNQKKIQTSATPTKRKKISNYQYHHQPHKPTSITTHASNHNYKHRKPKHTKIFRLVIQNCQPKPTNTENPNPNPGILKSKTKITNKRSGFLFLGIYLCMDEHGEWV